MSIAANELRWPETAQHDALTPGHDVAGFIAGKGSDVGNVFDKCDRVFAPNLLSRGGGAVE